MACGPETGMLDTAAQRAWPRILDDPAWPDAAVAFLEGRRRPRTGPLLPSYGVTPEEARRYLVTAERSPRALLEALTVPFARARGKSRIVEKTPGHQREGATIRRLWPDAPIVRIVRDPRPTALSLSRTPFGPPSPVSAAYSLASDERQSHRFFETDPRSITVRFEDLVADPVTHLGHLCESIGETFDERMLTPTETAREIVPHQPAWHARLSGPIDASRAEAWRRELSADDQRRIAMICADAIRRYGYEGAIDATVRAAIHPFDRHLISSERAARLLERAADAGIAFEALDAEAGRGKRLVLVGVPGELRWGSAGRVAGTVAAALRGRRPLWVRIETERPRADGPAERFGDVGARVFARTTDEAGVVEALAKDR
jgi:hypothetical protein